MAPTIDTMSSSLHGRRLRLTTPRARCSNFTVSADWRSVLCSTDAKAGQDSPHHPIFRRFSSWRGVAQRQNISKNDWHGYSLTDFLGFQIPTMFYCNAGYGAQPVEHALRLRQCSAFFAIQRLLHQQGMATAWLQTRWPVVSEEYFEYVDVLSAVDEYVSERDAVARTTAGIPTHRPFAFVDIGSGYGHWSFAAHLALRQRLASPTEVRHRPAASFR
jgi:hypothetical protein